MAVPNTKATLKEYCLRALGEPVIDVNVDVDQCDDRIDEALQYFAQYHYDGIERMYLKHLITADEVTRAKTNATTVGIDTADNSITANWLEGKGFIPIPSAVVSVIQVFPFADKAAIIKEALARISVDITGAPFKLSIPAITALLPNN